MNSIHAMTDLSSLPKPVVVEETSAELVLSQLKELFLTLEPKYELIHEDDPVMKLLEAFAYRELHLRIRINEAARANLLSFAKAGDLDQLASFYDTTRLENETDDELRFRVQLKAMGWVGNAPYYKYWALSSSPLVKDVAVYSPDHPNHYNMGGRVYVAVMSKEGNGTPSPQLMQSVREVLTSQEVKVLGDILAVEAAVARPINFAIKVYLLPGTPFATFEALEDKLRAAFAERQGLGFDVTRSWIISVLHVTGVHRVEVGYPIPAVTAIPPNEFPVINSLHIAFGGFADTEPSNSDAMEDARLRRLLYDYYLQYAVANQRTMAQIIADLVYAPVTGILQPTIQGLAQHLNITTAKNDKGDWLPEAEIALLIHRRLQPMYEAGRVILVG